MLSELLSLFPGVPIIESPLFYAMVDALGLTSSERKTAVDLHERGFAVIDFPDSQLEGRTDRIKQRLAPMFEIDLDDLESAKSPGQRIQDAWSADEDIRAIATNSGILSLLGKLYGRPAYPFQTLNFPTGTQQHLHSDSIHFSSVPERFMCGVWLAMEDVHPDAGPLTYLPGSHRWPIISNAMIGRRGAQNRGELAQAPFEAAWEALVENSDLEREVFLARKGQALIWAANLLHGGSPQVDARRTRWSQVTHYYFDDCIYYTPAFSDEPLGLLDLRSVVDVATEQPRLNTYLGEPIDTERPDRAEGRGLIPRLRQRIKSRGVLPADFDDEVYYQLNPDVAQAGIDAAAHYLNHGIAERRRYRYTQR